MTQPDTATQACYECSVEQFFDRNVSVIRYCPLHAAAPGTAAERDRLLAINAELLEAAKLALGLLNSTHTPIHFKPLAVAIAAAQVQP